MAPGCPDALGLCADSGQADLCESSDCAFLYHVCDELSAYKQATGLQPGPEKFDKFAVKARHRMTEVETDPTRRMAGG
jgi:hypothetical protein